MNDLQLISIIVPCYNQGQYLSEALDSILAQTYAHWECIIVNDGSTDQTDTIAKKYLAKDSRFRLINQNNSGLSAARNAAMRVASGNYIQFLDADDLIEKDKIRHQLEQYELVKNNVLIYSSMRYFMDGSPEKKLSPFGHNEFIAHIECKKNERADTILTKRNICVVSAPLYPSSLLYQQQFDENLSALEDWDLNLRLAANHIRFHHHYSENGLTLIRVRAGSMMTVTENLKQNYVYLRKKHQFDIKNYPLTPKDLIYNTLKELLPPVIFKIYQAIKK